MKELFVMIDDIEKTIKTKSKNRTSKPIYRRTNRLVEKFTQIVHFVIAILSNVCIIFPKAIISYFMYFATDAGVEAFELPLLYWFPFDWHNPIGYFIAVIIEYITLGCHFHYVACAASFGVGFFFFALSATKDVTNDLKTLNENAKIPGNRVQTLKQISEFIEFYSTLKEYVDYFLGIYQPIFVIMYIWSLVTICGVMLLVQMEMQGNGSLALLIITIFYAFYAFGLWLIVCELGQQTTDAFEGIKNEIQGFEWNLFSLELQKILPTILLGAQPPVELRIFGSSAGLRETFKKVVNSAYSYFAVIRQFLK